LSRGFQQNPLKSDKNRQQPSFPSFAFFALLWYYLSIFISKGRHPIRREPKEIERIFYTFREAQEFLNVSHQTIYELMKQGLPSHKIGRKRVFLIKDLVRWIEEH